MSALSAAHEGKYVFLVVRDGRSIPCNVLRVTGKKAVVQETDADDWPYTISTVKTKDVVFVFDSEEVERTSSEESNFMRRGAAEFFGYLRGYLNNEDELGRPRAEGVEPEVPGTSFDPFIAEQIASLA